MHLPSSIGAVRQQFERESVVPATSGERRGHHRRHTRKRARTGTQTRTRRLHTPFEEWCVTHVLPLHRRHELRGDENACGVSEDLVERRRSRKSDRNYMFLRISTRKGSRQAGVWQSRRTGERRNLHTQPHPRLPHRHAEHRIRFRRFRCHNAPNTRHADRSHTRRNIPTPILRHGNPRPTNLRDPKPFQRHSPKTPFRRKSRVIERRHPMNRVSEFRSSLKKLCADRNSGQVICVN